MSGWQCGRCGTMYGVLVTLKPPPKTAQEATVQAMTSKTFLGGHLDARRILFDICHAGKCRTTPRTLLWRLFGKRGHPTTGWRPGLRHGLRSLRRGDPLFVGDDWRPE